MLRRTEKGDGPLFGTDNSAQFGFQLLVVDDNDIGDGRTVKKSGTFNIVKLASRKMTCIGSVDSAGIRRDSSSGMTCSACQGEKSKRIEPLTDFFRRCRQQSKTEKEKMAAIGLDAEGLNFNYSLL